MTERLIATTVKLDETPALLDLIPDGRGIAWLTEGTSLLGKGECLRVDPGSGGSRFSGLAEQVEALLGGAEVEDEVDLPGSGPIAFGSWTFDPDSPGSSILVPSTVYGMGDGVAWKTSIRFEGPREHQTAPTPAPLFRRGDEQPPPSDEWVSSVKSALDEIREGRLQKVVLAREVVFEGAAAFDPREVLTRLVETYPGCFTFWFDGLVGASPELLIRRLGDMVDSIPLAGSAPRGIGEREDAELGRKLRASPKDREEHELTVQTVMDSLRPFCDELVAESEPSLLLLANMQHLSTKVQGRLTGAPSALELVAAIHPTAAVCGVPEEKAMQFIRATEGFRRGRYAGPVGWMDHKGDGEWAVALRCAELNGRVARIFAGAGIVAGSDPELELEETNLKLQVMLSALQLT